MSCRTGIPARPIFVLTRGIEERTGGSAHPTVVPCLRFGLVFAVVERPLANEDVLRRDRFDEERS